MKIIWLILALVFLSGCSQLIAPTLESPSFPIKYFDMEEVFNVEKVVNASMAMNIRWDEQGRMWWAELNSGKIKYLEGDKIITFAQVPNHITPSIAEGEAGLYSMEIDEEFVYVYVVSGGTNKVGRIPKDDPDDYEIIFDGIKQAKIHNGGELNFGHDGKLYLSTGDATLIDEDNTQSNPAQNVDLLEGKILRMNRDGSLPDDNPFPDSYTYAFGLRNIFKYAIHPYTGKIYGGEQGVACCEEINIIEEGKNYGWPLESGFNMNSIYEQPIFSWDERNKVSPTGMTFQDNDLYLGTWLTREIFKFELENETITSIDIYSLDPIIHERITGAHSGEVHKGAHPKKGILEVTTGPDGFVYFSELNAIYVLKLK